jgi:hypothetical protein
MRIVGIHLEPGGVGWHRLWCWTEGMERRGHDIWHRPHVGTQFQWHELDAIVNGADIVIAGRMHNAQVFAGLLAGRHLYNYKLVIDTDDNASVVPKYNQAFADYHVATGATKIVHAEFREADLVTVSTPDLLSYAKKHSHNVALVPNVVDTRRFASVRGREKEERHRGDLRLYWGGGGGHYDDLASIKSAVLRIFNEYPNLKLVFSNFIPDWAADLPPFRIFMIPFAHFNAYPKVLRWLCAEVAIAPLVDNEFNHCKSHVKYLDYAMARIPAVYQDLTPYDGVTHGVTGLKAKTPDEWYENIKALLDDAALRETIANNAIEDVLDKWTVDRWIPMYETLMKETVALPKAAEVKVSPLSEGAPIACQQL